MGPAKWTAVISLVLIVCGIIVVIGHFLRRKSMDASAGAAHRIASARGVILTALLLAWVTAVPVLGFNIGCLCFFPLLFYVSGLRPWFKSIAAGFIMTVLFYVIFVLGAKLPVPKGGIGLL